MRRPRSGSSAPDWTSISPMARSCTTTWRAGCCALPDRTCSGGAGCRDGCWNCAGGGATNWGGWRAVCWITRRRTGGFLGRPVAWSDLPWAADRPTRGATTRRWSRVGRWSMYCSRRPVLVPGPPPRTPHGFAPSTTTSRSCRRINTDRLSWLPPRVAATTSAHSAVFIGTVSRPGQRAGGTTWLARGDRADRAGILCVSTG